MADYNEVITALPYFGNIQFYAHCINHDMLVDVHEHFIKQSLRNRCELSGSQGRFSLTVPVHRPSGIKSPLKDIKISYAENWRHDHQQAVRSAYGSSPFFIHYWDEISSVWEKEFEFLIDLSQHAHEVISKSIGIKGALTISDSYIHSTPGLDLRPSFKHHSYQNEEYIQVFSDRMDFVQNLSLIDLLFCEGPACLPYLKRQKPSP